MLVPLCKSVAAGASSALYRPARAVRPDHCPKFQLPAARCIYGISPRGTTTAKNIFQPSAVSPSFERQSRQSRPHRTRATSVGLTIYKRACFTIRLFDRRHAAGYTDAHGQKNRLVISKRFFLSFYPVGARTVTPQVLSAPRSFPLERRFSTARRLSRRC